MQENEHSDRVIGMNQIQTSSPVDQGFLPIINPNLHEQSHSREVNDLFSRISNQVEVALGGSETENSGIIENGESQETIESQGRVPRSKQEIRSETRRDVLLMIARLKYQAGRAEIILGTKSEQDQFLSRIESYLLEPGVYAKPGFQENLEAMITEEVAKGITRAKSINTALGIDVIRSGKDTQFNFPSMDTNTTLVPMDLHLAFDLNSSVIEAKNRLERQYRGRFNAITLVNANKIPMGLIKTSELANFSDETLLRDIPLSIVGVSGTLNTPSEQIGASMSQHGINIFPLVDTQTEVLIGFVTHEIVAISETRMYLSDHLTKTREQHLRDEISG